MTRARLQMTLRPSVLQWARERAGYETDELASKLGVKPERVVEWEQSGRISLTQADKLAHYTHTPLGYLYLADPPEDRLPIPDFRTVGDRPLVKPSPDLLETVLLMQRRQAWMREEMIELGAAPLEFVQARSTASGAAVVAQAMRESLNLAPEWAADERSWTGALRHLRDLIENSGVLVVFNGVVGNNTHRKLDPNEFRGFALVDAYAPLIFINAVDSKAAQMFTLAHELAHVFIGADGVSGAQAFLPGENAVERFCNAVAAEFLVPAESLRAFWPNVARFGDPYQDVARRFRVSVLVAARRLLDLGLITRDQFFEFYRSYQQDERRQRRESGRGDFWNNQGVRIGYRFGAAIGRAVREGRLLYREAYALTGLRGKTFEKFVKSVLRE